VTVSFAQAKAEVVASITDEVVAAGAPVFDHDPTPGNPPRFYVAVTFGGLNALDWLIAVRVYSSPENDVKAGEDLAAAAIHAVEDALGPDVPRSVWTPLTWDPVLQLLIAETVVQVPREDF